MPDLSRSNQAFALAFSRPVEGQRYARSKVAEGPPNSRRDRGKDSRMAGVSSGRTTGVKYDGHHYWGARRDSVGASANGAAIAVRGSGIRVAYACDGAERGCSDHPDRLAALEWIDARDQEVRVPLCYKLNLGPCWRRVRCASVHLRDARFFFSWLAHRRAPGHCNSGFSDRACAALDSAATSFVNRDARRYSERDPWVVGNFCDDSLAPRLSGSSAQTLSWLDAVFFRTYVRTLYARRRDYNCNYDSADHHFGFTGDFAECAGFAARSSVRSWGHPMGSHADRCVELR